MPPRRDPAGRRRAGHRRDHNRSGPAHRPGRSRPGLPGRLHAEPVDRRIHRRRQGHRRGHRRQRLDRHLDLRRRPADHQRLERQVSQSGIGGDRPQRGVERQHSRPVAPPSSACRAPTPPARRPDRVQRSTASRATAPTDHAADHHPPTDPPTRPTTRRPRPRRPPTHRPPTDRRRPAAPARRSATASRTRPGPRRPATGAVDSRTARHRDRRHRHGDRAQRQPVGPDQRRRRLLQPRLHPVHRDLSGAGRVRYARIWVRHTTALPTAAHHDDGHARRRRRQPDLRLGGQNGALQWNRASDDATLPEQSPAGVALSLPLPPTAGPASSSWSTARPGQLRTWVDGAAIPG